MKEKESPRAGGDREGGRIPSRLHAVRTEPDAGLELTNCEMMSPAEVARPTDRAPQAPRLLLSLAFPSQFFWGVNRRPGKGTHGAEGGWDQAEEGVSVGGSPLVHISTWGWGANPKPWASDVSRCLASRPPASPWRPCLPSVVCGPAASASRELGASAGLGPQPGPLSLNLHSNQTSALSVHALW